MRRAALAVGLVLLSAGTARAEPQPAPASEVRFYAGARHRAELFTANALSLGRLSLRGVDAVQSAIVRDRRRAPWAVALRAATFVAVDLPLISYALVIPHEAFGHAERYRQFDGDSDVHLDLPLPYSLKADHFVTRRPGRPLYAGEESLTILAGLHVQEASQRMLAATVFQTNAFRRGDALLYASFAATHAAQTIAGTDLELASSLVRPQYGGDPTSYRATARTALALDLVDPMLLASLLQGARYFATGAEVSRAPSVEFGGARIFATSRTTPVPWGTEHALHVLSAFRVATFDLGVRTGFGARGSFGVDLSTFGYRLLDVVRLGAEAAFFVQPEITSVAERGPPPVILSATRVAPRAGSITGGAARILFEVDRPTWFLGTRLGYKTVGLWGERDLRAGFDVALTGGLRID